MAENRVKLLRCEREVEDLASVKKASKTLEKAALDPEPIVEMQLYTPEKSHLKVHSWSCGREIVNLWSEISGHLVDMVL